MRTRCIDITRNKSLISLRFARQKPENRLKCQLNNKFTSQTVGLGATVGETGRCQVRLWNWNMPKKKKREHEKHAVGQFKSFVKHQENAFECCTEN